MGGCDWSSVDITLHQLLLLGSAVARGRANF